MVFDIKKKQPNTDFADFYKISTDLLLCLEASSILDTPPGGAKKLALMEWDPPIL